MSTRKTNPNTSHKKTESEDSFYSIPSDSLEKHQLSSRVSSKKKKKSNFSNESSKTKSSSSKTIPTVSSRGGTQEPWSDGRFLEHLPSLYSAVDTPKEASETISVKSLFSDSSSSNRGPLNKKSSPSPHIASAKKSSKRDSSEPLIRDSRKESSKRDSPEPLIRDSRKESSKRDSPEPLIRDSRKESSKRDSPKPLIRDSRKESSKRDSPEPLIRDSGKESSKRDSRKSLIRDSRKESSKRDSPKSLIRDSKKRSTKRDSSKHLVRFNTEEFSERDSPEPLIRDSRKESSKRDSSKSLIRDSRKESSKRDSPKPLISEESYKRDSPKQLVRFNTEEISEKDSPKSLIRDSRKESSKRDSSKALMRVSDKESYKRDSPEPLVIVSTEKFSKRDSPKSLIRDSRKKLTKRDTSKPLIRVSTKEFYNKDSCKPQKQRKGRSKESSKRGSPKCLCPKASSKKCSSCLTETIKVLSKSCFLPTSNSLENQGKKKMKIIFQDPRTEQETTVIIDDEDDRVPMCSPCFLSDCFKKRAPTSRPKKRYRSSEMADVYVNDPNKGNSYRRKKSRSKNRPGSSEAITESSCQCSKKNILRGKTAVYSAHFLTRYRTNGFKKIRQSKVNSSRYNSLHGHCRVCSILDRGLNLHNQHLLEQRNELMQRNKAGNNFLNTESSQVMETLYLQSMNDYVTENVFVEKRGKYIKRINEVRKSKKFIIPSHHLLESKKLESKQFTLLNQTTSSTSSGIVHLSQLRSTSIIATYSGMLSQCSEQSASIGPKLRKYNYENYKNKQIKNSIWKRLFKIFYQNKPFKTKNVGV
uniref:Uncharacterized protein n=2 Tax=Rhodnius prolixus TaxID=13249 RepID=T1I9L0_RHOPR